MGRVGTVRNKSGKSTQQLFCKQEETYESYYVEQQQLNFHCVLAAIWKVDRKVQDQRPTTNYKY